jgi:DnaJ-class molecular chaperone
MSQAETPGSNETTHKLTCPNCGAAGRTTTDTYQGRERTRCTECNHNQPTLAFKLAADVDGDERGVHPAEEEETVDQGAHYERF